MELTTITPVLRIFDEVVARDFYLDFLGFSLDWEHRFEPDLPLYAQISRGKCVIHISGHFGDGSPGARLRIDCDDVEALQTELLAKRYKHSRPSAEVLSWGKELSLSDPFGNRIIFWERNPP